MPRVRRRTQPGGMVSTEAEETPVQDLPSSRAEAKRLGYTHYFTGKPCKRGHVCSRRTSDRGCVRCGVEKAKRERENDPERARARCRRWARKNPGWFRQWDKGNRGARAESSRRYRQRYPGKEKARQSAYAKVNSDYYAYCTAKRRAKKMQATPQWVNYDAIRGVFAKAQRLTEETGIEHHVDHVYPLQGRNVSGLHVADNLQVVPATVNLSKSNKHPEEVEA